MVIARLIHINLVALVLLGLALSGCGKDEVYFIRGSARLPDCMDPPAADLDGTEWYDNGVVTIESAGCGSAQPDDMFNVCALDWVMTQEGGDIEIIVDNEYRILGRLCGNDLYLEGGWWLPVEDEGFCTYAEDSADEVGIDADGNVLTLGLQPGSTLYQASGTLSLSGPCDASYSVTLTQKFFR